MRRSSFVRHSARAFTSFAFSILSYATVRPVHAQSTLAGGLPGSWVEANAFAHSVSNDYGNWGGTYLRFAHPSATDTWYADALAMRAFGEEGAQFGATHRHDWSSRVFHMFGANVGSGAAILPRFRADGALGVKLGETRSWQATGGVSYVKSVTALHDVAPFASLAWYAPHAVVIEVGGRYNISNPGDIKSYRLTTTTMWTPSPKRTFSLRAGAGTEGYQTVSVGTIITRFSSEEFTLSWREMVAKSVALSLQVDGYHNPYYTRSGASLGVARYW